MKIKRYCFFGSFLQTQENGLNRMAKNGYRLVQVDKLLYEWEECPSSRYEYRVEFIAFRTSKDAKDYVAFLEDLGYRVFFKNINWNYSVGKVNWDYCKNIFGVHSGCDSLVSGAAVSISNRKSQKRG